MRSSTAAHRRPSCPSAVVSREARSSPSDPQRRVLGARQPRGRVGFFSRGSADRVPATSVPASSVTAPLTTSGNLQSLHWPTGRNRTGWRVSICTSAVSCDSVSCCKWFQPAEVQVLVQALVQVLVQQVQVLVKVLVLIMLSPCRLVDFTRLPSPTPENKDLFFVTKGSSLQPASGDH